MAYIYIGGVERETGVSRDVLRMWERRYRFPLPDRDPIGDRVYTLEQIERLQLIKRLMDGGHRAGAVVGQSRRTLLAMLRKGSVQTDGCSKAPSRLMGFVSQGRIRSLRSSLGRSQLRLGLPSLLRQLLAPLNAAVGQAWQSGSLPIHKEHAYTEMVQGFLRDSIAALPPARLRPRVLLTTLPGEQHGLGLLMISALCGCARVENVPLGTQTPVEEIVEAARFHASDVVALSFSSAYPRHLIRHDVRKLKKLLPSDVELWLGGAGVGRLPSAVAGTRCGSTLDDVVDLIEIWTAESQGGNTSSKRVLRRMAME